MGASRRAPEWGEEGRPLTEKPGEVAQVLSPAALTMQPLSMWPEPTRLLAGRVSDAGRALSARAWSGARTSSQHRLRHATS